MKRLIALMLLVLLPVNLAMADTMKTEIIMTVDADQYTEELMPYAQALMGMSEAEAKTFLNAVVKVFSGFGVKLITQEDALSFELLAANKRLADCRLFDMDDTILVLSDMFPGYGVCAPEDLVSSIPLVQRDLTLIANGMMAAFVNAATPVMERMTTTRGSFSGDAYTGGVYCTSVRIEDRDIAQILMAIQTDDFRQALTAFAGVEAEYWLGQLDQMHQGVAERNEYSYLFRFVTDAQEKPIGISLTVLQGSAQLMTASMGAADEDSLHIVIGIGRASDNLWYDAIITVTDNQISGECVSFAAEKDADYSYASAVTSDMLSECSWALVIEREGSLPSWNFTLDLIEASDPVTQQIVHQGKCEPDGGFTTTTSCLLDNKPYITFDVNHVKVDAIEAPQTAVLKLCTFNSSDESELALFNEITEMAGQILSMRLMLIVPSDVWSLPIFN